MSSFRGTAAPLSALLTGVALLLLGTGLLNTLLSVRAVQNGLDSTLLGLVMSAYFVGFILGTFLSPVMIRRVGHIRTFACCAAVAASTSSPVSAISLAGSMKPGLQSTGLSSTTNAMVGMRSCCPCANTQSTMVPEAVYMVFPPAPGKL